MVEPVDPFFPEDAPPNLPEVLPVVALRDLVVFPSIIVPLSVSREQSIKAIDDALAGERLVLLLSQTDEELEAPGWSDLYRVGCAASIMRMLTLLCERARAAEPPGKTPGVSFWNKEEGG